jgi:hypothetical protein
MREFLQLLGIDAGLTTAYHPQANGMTERMNAEVVKYLQLFCDQRQDNWAPLLPMAEFVINSREVAARKNTPFEVQYGYRPNFTIPARRATPFPSIAQCLEHLRKARKDTKAAMRMAKEQLCSDNNTRAHRLHVFAKGDKVWLDAKDIDVHQPLKKLGPKRLGPFTVVKRVGDLNYQLALPPLLKLHDVFHVDRLSPWKGRDDESKEGDNVAGATSGPLIFRPFVAGASCATWDLCTHIRGRRMSMDPRFGFSAWPWL